jgi:pimeloyl-ACP methyl ester carboxylesterase
MKIILSEIFYQQVPVDQQERLSSFRTAHPRQQVDLLGVTWSYLLGGQGSETLLILPGGERLGDVAFPLMEQFEPACRCLYPAYPPLATMEALLDGLAALLDRLSIAQVILFAASFGGDVGQCFVRTYPERVSKLILLNTGLPEAQLGKAARLGKVLISLLPLRIMRLLLQRRLMRGLAVRSEEQPLFQAILRELVAHLTRADLLSAFDGTIDYHLHYRFSPEDLSTWSGNVLILQSDDDPVTTPARRLALRQVYPQAQMHLFQQAGHTPFLSQPDEFYPLVRTFLRES